MVSYSSLCIYWKWPERLKKGQGILVVVFSFVSLLAFGSINTIGNMAPYIASYIRFYSRPSSFRYTDATYLYVVQVGMEGISAIIGGLAEKRLGPRMVILIGSLMMTSGTLLSYFTIKHSFVALLITYGFMFGVGVGLAYVVLSSCAIRWWPNYKGIASAVALSGYGLSPLVFNFVQTWFINPDNMAPSNAPYVDNPQERYFDQQETLERVPIAFLLLGFIYLLLQSGGLVFITYPLPEKSSRVQLAFQNPSYEQKQESAKLNNQSTVVTDSLQPQQMIKKCNFYILFIMLSIAGTAISFYYSLYKTFALEEVTDDDHFITIAGSVGSAFGAIGLIFWGILSDLTDFKFAMVMNSGLTTFLLFTFYATSAGGKGMLFVWICGLSFSSVGYYVHFPIAVSKGFGEKYLSANYGVLFFSQTVGVVLAGLISDYAVLLTGWHGTFLLLGLLSFVQFLLILCYRHVSYSRKLYKGDLRMIIYAYL